jgi:hypothetical protein
MNRRLVVKAMLFGQSLPFRSRRWLHQWRHTRVEQIVVLVQIDDIENHSLVLLAIINREVEPETMTRIARVGSQTQIVLEFTNEQNIPEISRLERSIEAQVAYKLSCSINWIIKNVEPHEPFFALPLCPAGRMISRLTFPNPPSSSESSLSAKQSNKFQLSSPLN